MTGDANPLRRAGGANQAVFHPKHAIKGRLNGEDKSSRHSLESRRPICEPTGETVPINSFHPVHIKMAACKLYQCRMHEQIPPANLAGASGRPDRVMACPASSRSPSHAGRRWPLPVFGTFSGMSKERSCQNSTATRRAAAGTSRRDVGGDLISQRMPPQVGETFGQAVLGPPAKIEHPPGVANTMPEHG